MNINYETLKAAIDFLPKKVKVNKPISQIKRIKIQDKFESQKERIAKESLKTTPYIFEDWESYTPLQKLKALIAYKKALKITIKFPKPTIDLDFLYKRNKRNTGIYNVPESDSMAKEYKEGICRLLSKSPLEINLGFDTSQNIILQQIGNYKSVPYTLNKSFSDVLSFNSYDFHNHPGRIFFDKSVSPYSFKIPDGSFSLTDLKEHKDSRIIESVCTDRVFIYSLKQGNSRILWEQGLPFNKWPSNQASPANRQQAIEILEYLDNNYKNLSKLDKEKVLTYYKRLENTHNYVIEMAKKYDFEYKRTRLE